MPANSPKSNRKAKADAILAAADELFGERGYDAVSARDVARAAGVNKALVFYYFGSMEELFARVLTTGEGSFHLNGAPLPPEPARHPVVRSLITTLRLEPAALRPGENVLAIEASSPGPTEPRFHLEVRLLAQFALHLLTDGDDGGIRRDLAGGAAVETRREPAGRIEHLDAADEANALDVAVLAEDGLGPPSAHDPDSLL